MRNRNIFRLKNKEKKKNVIFIYALFGIISVIYITLRIIIFNVYIDDQMKNNVDIRFKPPRFPGVLLWLFKGFFRIII